MLWVTSIKVKGVTTTVTLMNGQRSLNSTFSVFSIEILLNKVSTISTKKWSGMMWELNLIGTHCCMTLLSFYPVKRSITGWRGDRSLSIMRREMPVCQHYHIIIVNPEALAWRKISFSLIKHLHLANFTFCLTPNIFSLLEGQFTQTPAAQCSNNSTNDIKGGREGRRKTEEEYSRI